MNGKAYMSCWGQARDRKIVDVKRRLSLALCGRNQTEITRLTRELKRLGQSW